MNNLTLNIYDDNDEIIKTVEASFVSLRFGTIQKLTKLLKVEEIENTAELLNILMDAWEEVTKILNKVFPDVEENEWANVKIDELLPIVVSTLKGSFSYMLTIPQGQSKN